MEIAPTCNVCLTVSRNLPPAKITTCTVYVNIQWEIDTRIPYDFDGCGDFNVFDSWKRWAGSCAHLIHIKSLKINLDRLCFRLHDGSNDGTWVDLKGGGGCLEISPFVEVWIIKTTFQAKLRKYRGVFKVYGHIIKNVSSKSNVWMDHFKDWLHIWIQQNLIQCVYKCT